MRKFKICDKYTTKYGEKYSTIKGRESKIYWGCIGWQVIFVSAIIQTSQANFFLKSSSLFYKLEKWNLGRLSNVSKVTQQANVELKLNSLTILLLSFYLHTIAFQNKDIKWEIKGNTIILKLYSWRMGVLSVEHKARMNLKEKEWNVGTIFPHLSVKIYIYMYILQHFAKVYLTTWMFGS